MPIPFKEFPYDKSLDLGEVSRHNIYFRPVYNYEKWVGENTLGKIGDKILYGSRLLIQHLLKGVKHRGLHAQYFAALPTVDVNILLPRKKSWEQVSLMRSDAINVKLREENGVGVVQEEVVYGTKNWLESNEVEEGEPIGIFPTTKQQVTIIIQGGTQRLLNETETAFTESLKNLLDLI